MTNDSSFPILAPPIAAAHDRRPSVWRAHLYILPSFLLSLAVCAWFATCGDWNFFAPQSLAAYYDAQALSILNGHLDVPREAIGFEAFIVSGKYYGYFGIGPALLRIPLLLLFANLDGLWSRAMVVIASALSLACAYRLLLLLRGDATERTRSQRVLDSLFILCAALGSTNIFLVARSFTFHEAIIWSSTFALLFACALVKYFRAPSALSLSLASAFAFMSFQSRATAGAGALLGLCVVAFILITRTFAKKETGRALLGFNPVAQPLRHSLFAIFAVLLTSTTYFGVNYAKFGTLSGLPLQHYNRYALDTHRVEITGARVIHIENLPTGIATYFGIRGARLEPHFPWIYLSEKPTLLGTPAIDVVEGFSTFPVSMPALTLLATLGLIGLARSGNETVRRLRLPACTLLIGGSISLMTVGITERYRHDLYPALMICAAIGLCQVASGRNLRIKIIALALLTLISIAINSSFALVGQRVAPWGVPAEKRAEFDRLQQRIDGSF